MMPAAGTAAYLVVHIGASSRDGVMRIGASSRDIGASSRDTGASSRDIGASSKDGVMRPC